MGQSMLDLQRDSIIQAIRDASRGQWKILVVDEDSWKLVSSVVKEDEILSNKIMNIEHLEQKRTTQRDTDAIYLLTPESHIVDCVVADMERRRYREIALLWTSILPAELRGRIDKSPAARGQIKQLRVIDVGYFPREAQVITFRDLWSFFVLFHPGCNHLVHRHLSSLAQKIVSVCVSLGEYPTIRYYKPPDASHEAAVLCSHLARFVQEEIDMYATYHNDFPPQTNRPRATLYILDRTLDIVAPIVHEFTYQAMVHDLLPVSEGDKVTYKITINEGRPDQEEKEPELSEKDKIWTTNRHKHMKDTIDKLMGEFQRFMDENPHFKDANSATSLNAIKDMMAGLPEFQEMKEAYSLHLTMAQECMNIFQKRKLADLASIEQSLATGLDEDYKKPKNLADQVVRSLDDEAVSPSDRLRLIMLYLLFRDGLLPADVVKLLAHADLSSQREGEVIRNLSHLGVRTARQLKDPRPVAAPLFPTKPPPSTTAEDSYSLSRFQPAVKHLLEEHARNSLSQDTFPYTKPQLDSSDGAGGDTLVPTSLRSTSKPSWAKSRGSSTQAPRQRVLVFMAGGATFSEARACYEASEETSRDVYLITSHMLSPNLFLRQVGDLSSDRRSLRLPMEAPAKKAPAHLFEPEHPPPQQQQPQQQPPPKSQPPTSQMANMRLDPGNAGRNGHLSNPYPQGSSNPSSSSRPNSSHVDGKEKPKEKEKKKHKFGFGLR